jgi:hypothetical protein
VSSISTREPASYLSSCKNVLKTFFRKNRKPISINHDFHTTVGIEFEGLISSHLSYKDIGEFIKSYLSKKNPHIIYEVEEIAYMTRGGGILRKVLVRSKSSDQEYIYTIKFEESLDAPLGKDGVEITSPILRKTSDLDEFTSVLEHLKGHQVDEFPQGGGIHVHYGLKRTPSLKQTYKLYKYLDQMYDSLIKTLDVDKSRMHYLKRADFQLLVERIRIKLMKEEGHEHIDEEFARGQRSLIRFVSQYGTVEMRVFDSTMSGDHLNIYTDFVNKFFKAWESENDHFEKLFESGVDVDALKVSEVIGAKLALLKNL